LDKRFAPPVPKHEIKKIAIQTAKQAHFSLSKSVQWMLRNSAVFQFSDTVMHEAKLTL
jgi:hypothetical protein